MSQAKILSAVRAISEEKAVTPLEVEARLNRANAMIYLLSAALMHELHTSDSRRDRAESTACGINDLEADLRTDLASLI